MTPRALRFARFEKVEDFLRVGWMVSIPNAAMHHHYYGCELKWICDCPVPGGFKTTSSNRVIETPAKASLVADGDSPEDVELILRGFIWDESESEGREEQ